MERLQKVIAHAGIASRRKAEELITSGKVKVNGTVVFELGTKVSRHDEIEVNGILIEKENHVYYVINKPAGCISATQDDKGRRVITDFIGGEVKERLYPIGRLDYDTTGVLLLTNDGEIVNQLLRPESGLEKEYLVKIKGLLRKESSMKITRGINIGGYTTKRCKIISVEYDKKKEYSTVKIIITEGKYHQVKRMFEAVGHYVVKLKRVRFGCVTAEGLALGDYRKLKPYELKTLKHLIK